MFFLTPRLLSAMVKSPRCLSAAYDPCEVLGHGALHSITQLDDTICKLFGRPQRQRDVTVTPRYQRNAVSDEYGNDADNELVDRLRIKKRGDDFTAAHQPDILARLLAEPAHEWA